jgi:predicted small metal-binding protein
LNFACINSQESDYLPVDADNQISILLYILNSFFFQFLGGWKKSYKYMKTLSCKDMGGSDDFVAKGDTEEAVMEKMNMHVKEMHPEMMEGKSEEDMTKMKEMMKTKMKDEM